MASKYSCGASNEEVTLTLMFFWAFSGYFLQNLIYDLGFASMYRWCAIPGAIIICIILLLFDARKWLFFGSLSLRCL